VPVIFKQPFHNLRVARDTTGTLFGKSNNSLVSLDSTRCCSGSTLLVNKLEEPRFIGIALAHCHTVRKRLVFNVARTAKKTKSL